MAELFDDPLSALVFALKGGTDGDSPLSQALMDKLRKGVEILTELTFGTGDSGTATSDPSETVLTDSAGGFSTDEHNGRTLLILSGNAAGNSYTIDDTTSTTLTCTGDTLYTDGVRDDDEYLVLYDIKKARSNGGHRHDGEDSRLVENARGRTLVFCHGSEETEQSLDTYAEKARFRVYIPSNPSTLAISCFLKTDNSSETATVKVTVTDSGSTSVSGTGTSITTTYGTTTFNIGCSGLVAGWASIIIELKIENGANTASLCGITGHWNT